MKMIEDIPTLGPVSATVRLPRPPSRVSDTLSGEPVACTAQADGRYTVNLPSLHIHSAIVFDDSAA